jgi:hypothetical protein
MAKITQSLYNVLVDTVCGYMYMHNIKKRCIVTTAKKLTMEIKFEQNTEKSNTFSVHSLMKMNGILLLY